MRLYIRKTGHVVSHARRKNRVSKRAHAVKGNFNGQTPAPGTRGKQPAATEMPTTHLNYTQAKDQLFLENLGKITRHGMSVDEFERMAARVLPSLELSATESSEDLGLDEVKTIQVTAAFETPKKPRAEIDVEKMAARILKLIEARSVDGADLEIEEALEHDVDVSEVLGSRGIPAQDEESLDYNP